MRTSIALAVLALGLLVVPGAVGTRSYSDPAGDSGPAPDITSVAVSHDDAGFVTLAVTTNQPTLSPDAFFWGYFDTDRNTATGMSVKGLGADVIVIGGDSGGFIGHVNGIWIEIDFNAALTTSFANGVFTAKFNRSVLGTTDRFAFAVRSELGNGDGDTLGSDDAPDGPPGYAYSFIPLALTVATPTATPKTPVSGKRFVVSVAVTRNDEQPFTAGNVTCTARAGKVTLKPVGSAVSGTARCAMRVPKGMSGKTLRGTITVSAEDSSPVKRAFSFPVR
jgi:hypothetical protein